MYERVAHKSLDEPKVGMGLLWRETRVKGKIFDLTPLRCHVYVLS